MNLTTFKEQLFGRGKQAGFTEMELYYQSGERFTANAFKGEAESAVIAGSGGLSFRGVYNGKMGYAYTEKIDESSIDLLIDGVRAGAGVIDSEEEEPIWAGSPSYPEVDLYAEALQSITADQKIDLIKRLEAECFKLDSRVVNVMTSQIGTEQGERMIANSRGLDVSERSNSAFLVAGVMVREGKETKTAWDFQICRSFAQFEPAALAKSVVGEAISYLGAQPVESRPYPVLLKNSAAIDLLGAFTAVFFASNVQKGKSLLKGKIGTQVAGPNITIIDDPLMPGGLASRSFDSEGVASQRMAVIEAGVLKNFFYNLKTAQVDGVSSTGHAHKPSYKGAISISPSNLYIEPGQQSYEQLVAGCEEAVVVTSVQGLHAGANAISGDFSLAAHGYYVKGGKIVRPVNQITIAGNFYQLLNSIEAVGSDLKFDPGFGANVGSPTLKVKSLAVSGK